MNVGAERPEDVLVVEGSSFENSLSLLLSGPGAVKISSRLRIPLESLSFIRKRVRSDWITSLQGYVLPLLNHFALNRLDTVNCLRSSTMSSIAASSSTPGGAHGIRVYVLVAHAGAGPFLARPETWRACGFTASDTRRDRTSGVVTALERPSHL
jgi:hypothetical protein